MNQGTNTHYKKKMNPNGEEYVETAPRRNSQSIVINAPRSEVWDAIDDTPGFTEWFPGLKSASMEVVSEKGMGAKRLGHLNGFKYYEEIKKKKKNEAWGFTMLESNSGACKSITEVIYLESIDENNTKVTYKGGYEYGGIFRWISGMMSKEIAKTWNNALNGLKEHIEK